MKSLQKGHGEQNIKALMQYFQLQQDHQSINWLVNYGWIARLGQSFVASVVGHTIPRSLPQRKGFKVRVGWVGNQVPARPAVCLKRMALPDKNRSCVVVALKFCHIQDTI